MLQNFPQLLFLVLGERSFENLALESLESLQRLVRGGFTHQHKESGGSRLESLPEFLDEIVADTEIAQFAGQRSGAGTNRSARKRVPPFSLVYCVYVENRQKVKG